MTNLKFDDFLIYPFIHIYTYIYIYIYKFFVVGTKGETNILKQAGPQSDMYFLRIYLFILFLHRCIFPACCFCQTKYMAQGLAIGVLSETLQT